MNEGNMEGNNNLFVEENMDWVWENVPPQEVYDLNDNEEEEETIADQFPEEYLFSANYETRNEGEPLSWREVEQHVWFEVKRMTNTKTNTGASTFVDLVNQEGENIKTWVINTVDRSISLQFYNLQRDAVTLKENKLYVMKLSDKTFGKANQHYYDFVTRKAMDYPTTDGNYEENHSSYQQDIISWRELPQNTWLRVIHQREEKTERGMVKILELLQRNETKYKAVTSTTITKKINAFQNKLEKKKNANIYIKCVGLNLAESRDCEPEFNIILYYI